MTFNNVLEPKTDKNRLHLDVSAIPSTPRPSAC